MRSLRGLLLTSIVVLITVAPGVTHATPEFPGLIQTDLMLNYDLNTMPPTNCVICHMTNAGGLHTLIGFGQNMKNIGGLAPYEDGTLQPALDTLQQMGTDSDCNKIPDIKQLEMGYNPNFPGEYIGNPPALPNLDPPDGGCSSSAQPTPVFYGCGAQLSPAAPSGECLAPLVTALTAALALARARARRRR